MATWAPEMGMARGPQLHEKVVSIGAAVFTGPPHIPRMRVAPRCAYRAHFPCPLWACHGRASLEGGHGDPLRFTSQCPLEHPG